MSEELLGIARGALISIRATADMALRLMSAQSDGAEPRPTEPDPNAQSFFSQPQPSEDK